MDKPDRPPIIVRNRADIALHLANERRAQGLTCEALDYKAGFSDRYTAKLEHGDSPSGRQAFHISPMGELWLEALGLCLLVCTHAQAALTGATAAPPRSKPQPTPEKQKFQNPARLTVRRIFRRA